MSGKPKPIDNTKTLEFARGKGNLNSFIKAHEADPKGDLDKMDAILATATGAVRQARGGSKQKRSRKRCTPPTAQFIMPRL